MKIKTKGSDPFPAWADAHLALKYINKGKARGSRAGLWVRGESQVRLGHVGKWAGRRGGLVILFGIVALALLCVGNQHNRLDTTLDSLWTPDSGRLQQELSYVSKVSGLTTDTNEMLIQTPKKNSHHSILNSRALLEHLDVLQRALAVTVDLYDLTWSVKDLCYSPNIPNFFDVQFIDQIFEKIFPCGIVTPLDCFWEGAKLLGPEFPIQIPGFRGPMKWTNLNPQELLNHSRIMLSLGSPSAQGFPFEILEGIMKRAGVGSGYLEKPCLNPADPACPLTAPNHGSGKVPDVAATLAQGCYGFAPRFMHWAPDLIIGGQVHNKSGHLIKAGGLMSTVQLMSSSELFEYSRETWRLHHIEWTESKAKDVLQAWQARFAAEVSRLSLDEDRTNHFNFYSFTAAGLDTVVESASQFSFMLGGLRVTGVMTAVILVGVFLNGSLEDWKVRVGLLIAGTLVALAGTAAGAGIAGFLKIPFNVATVQVLPYLTLSLSSQLFYVLLYSQLNLGYDPKATLKRHGFSLILGVLVMAAFVGAGALFPIPAVRSLALQGSILFMLSSFAVLFIFPAVCQLVLKRRRIPTAARPQLAPSNRAAGSQAHPFIPGAKSEVPLVLLKNNNVGKEGSAGIDVELGEGDQKVSKPVRNWIQLYIILVDWKWFMGIVFCLYVVWMGFSGVGIYRLRLGLPITDVVPSNSSEWEFLSAQVKLFPVYHMRAVTKANFDYPNNQKLLHKFHETMSGLPWIIRDDNGGKPPMWLSVFRSWLTRLQTVFDTEWKLGYLHKEDWTRNASADGILAWKLAVQTGHIEHPVDVTQLPGNRLVDNDGVINSRAFYVYLSAWASNDPLAYGSTAANLRPEPRSWVHLPGDQDLKIPKSLPIRYAEISYILKTSGEDEEGEYDHESQILLFVKEIRSICSSFETRGLPVFPWGIPFRFYEQYLNLPLNSGVVLGLAGGSITLILFFSLGFSLRPLGLLASLSFVTLAQLGGTIGWLGVGLNALPIEIALLGVSLVVVAGLQVVVAFCCIPGTLAIRRSAAFTLVGPPSAQALILISLTALILYSPQFTFIFTHFTLLVSLAAVYALLNVLLLLPLLLSIFQPLCWLVGPVPEDPSFLQPLTPSPVPRRSREGRSSRSAPRPPSRGSSRGSGTYNNQPPPYSYRGGSGRSGSGGSQHRNSAHARAPSEHSLSTITEEPTSCATRRSAEIIVQPQVVVETFGLGESGSGTKTKVSAKLKVEVHSSVHNSTPSCSTATNPQSSLNSNMSEGSTSSSGSFTSSSASSSTSSYNELEGRTN